MVVAAAIIVRDGKILLARRKEGKRLGGFWEFPGGKLEPEESAAECLERELREELGIKAVVGRELMRSIHEYEFGRVELIAILVDRFDGELAPRDHDLLEWADPRRLADYRLAPADVPIADALARRLG